MALQGALGWSEGMVAVAAAAATSGTSQVPCDCLDPGSYGNRNELPKLIPVALCQGPYGQP